MKNIYGAGLEWIGKSNMSGLSCQEVICQERQIKFDKLRVTIPKGPVLGDKSKVKSWVWCVHHEE